MVKRNIKNRITYAVAIALVATILFFSSTGASWAFSYVPDDFPNQNHGLSGGHGVACLYAKNVDGLTSKVILNNSEADLAAMIMEKTEYQVFKQSCASNTAEGRVFNMVNHLSETSDPIKPNVKVSQESLAKLKAEEYTEENSPLIIPVELQVDGTFNGSLSVEVRVIYEEDSLPPPPPEPPEEPAPPTPGTTGNKPTPPIKGANATTNTNINANKPEPVVIEPQLVAKNEPTKAIKNTKTTPKEEVKRITDNARTKVENSFLSDGAIAGIIWSVGAVTLAAFALSIVSDAKVLLWLSKQKLARLKLGKVIK